jgi:hypothetical protein
MISKYVLRDVHEIGLMAGISIILIAKVNAQAIYPPIGTPLPDPPQVVSPFELRAINDPATGKSGIATSHLEDFYPVRLSANLPMLFGRN